MSADARQPVRDGSEIAIVGMACRFPGADDIEAFWRNLRDGVESLTRLSDEDLERSGVDPELARHPGYVRHAALLDRIEDFDPAFFGYTLPEARLIDPQQRLFLECAWEALERAGYDPDRCRETVGVFTGAKTNTYLLQLAANREALRGLDEFQVALGNDLACMATRVSYKLNLRGPSYALHTACSTSLVAVHLACQSLLLGECRMALAGGASINVPQRRGYLFQPGGILSPDGSCRTFDEGAAGSNFGNGVGAVLLKRLEDAVADGDHVHAVILGSATNNDGAAKASYTAPGVEGQTAVLLEAMACAGVAAGTLSYVEAHGTATQLGDAIEMLALAEAFRAAGGTGPGRCAIGSVKTNVGHLEVAAGVAGLIKTALALERRQIPASLHFRKPNPRIDFAGGPFYVNTATADWPDGAGPRRAGVSSFGIGSTNAHVVLEEPPPPPPPAPSRPWQLLVLSARSAAALERQSANLARALAAAPAADRGRFADTAYTLSVGRRAFPYRRVLVCRDAAAAAAAWSEADRAEVLTHHCERAGHPAAFMLPGLGEHGAGMAQGLYDGEAVFRAEIDRCAALLRPHLGVDLRQALYPPAPAAATAAGGANADGGTSADGGTVRGPDLRRMLGRAGRPPAGDLAPQPLRETWLAQPALFAVEYALAKLWQAWGVRPQAMIGHSLGEYVAACLGEVMSLPDALRLVAWRARAIQQLPAGAMLAVPLGEEQLAPLLAAHGVSLAAVNGPETCVAAGPVAAVQGLEGELASRGVVCRRLPTAHAFHSAMMEPLAAPLAEQARTIALRPPSIPYVSNVTGTWITAAQATDPGYWSRHLCQPVRFAAGVAELLRDRRRLLLEVGPGTGLSSFVRQHPACDAAAAQAVCASLGSSHGGQDDHSSLLTALGRLWLAGQPIDWAGFWAGERRRRVPLPTYPFERQRCWIEPARAPHAAAGLPAPAARRRVTLDRQPDLADWFYRPAWRREPPPAPRSANAASGESAASWLVFHDPCGLGAALAATLRGAGHRVLGVTAAPGAAGLTRTGEDEVAIRPAQPEDYEALLAAFAERTAGGAAPGSLPAGVLHLWGVTAEPAAAAGGETAQDLGFFSLLFLAQAIGRRPGREPVRLTMVSTGLHAVIAGDRVLPEKATALGPCRVIPQELPRLLCRAVDLSGVAAGDAAWPHEAARLLLAELDGEEPVVAYRGGERWVQDFTPIRLEGGAGGAGGGIRLRERGVYLLTGGMGGLGLTLARHLARTVRARLVLTGASQLPERAGWQSWIDGHPPDDRVSARIGALRELEALGAEVLACSADAADERRMAAVLAEARQRFGAIHGIVHLAGTPGGGILQLKTREAAARVMAPKVAGARVLERLLGECGELDFVVLFSSIASILGEFGQVDYCAANAFLDATAWRDAARGHPQTITIDWDIWREVGLAVHTEVPAHLRQWRQEMLEQAITPAEGVEAFVRVLGAGVPQVVVSAQPLAGRIELGRSFTGESFLAELTQGLPPAPEASRRPLGTRFVGATNELERRLAEIWQRLLGLEAVGVNDNFFDLGGNSLLGLQLVAEIGRELGMEVLPVTLFESPTVAALARCLQPETGAATAVPAAPSEPARERSAPPAAGAGTGSGAIAIIAMSGRFPGARDVEDLWLNLRSGVESVRFFSDQELLAAGVGRELFERPGYVRAGAVLDGIDLFDAALFGMSPREAEVTDPQHRLFLECAWEALERAGYDPATYPGAIGVFAGCNLSTYLLELYSDPDVRRSVNLLQAILGNDKDSLTTLVSYKLNLRGPSVGVQTFCSTSLVAVHMACRSLRQGECDMALAGGVRIVVPDRQGYLYEPGGIAPADGHSRPFDARANGSVLGQGVGIVCLERLEDALAAGDPVLAVIKGSAVNNDGSLKAGYTAPSVAGQAQAVTAALADADVDPATISYLEAHGSATELGDPIELAALTQAFRRYTDRVGHCAIGSVKSNFGHLDRAAGVTGLIKTVLALRHGEIPPTINFELPNPRIDFAASPFHVNDRLTPWPTGGAPRRAAVNSLGMGGTNVHVILEEAPAAADAPPADGRPWHLLALSARTETALDAAIDRLAEHLRRHPELDLADAAYTLQVGRRGLPCRSMLVCRDLEDAAAALAARTPGRLVRCAQDGGERPVVWLLSGLGGQYPDMGRDLYRGEPGFRAAIDRCAELLAPLLGLDLREVLYPGPGAPPAAARPAATVDLRRMLGRAASRPPAPGEAAAARLQETWLSQPALFALEYALAQLFLEWGVRPQALAGYSLGEYVAACLAGVMSLPDALTLVARRALLIQELPAGAMLAVGLGERELLPLLGEELSLAAVNGPQQAVAAGAPEEIAALERRLAARGVASRRLQAAHAFHSRQMLPLADRVAELAAGIELRPPRIPFLSNLTGTWIADEEATDPAYWARHLVAPVRFSEAVTELCRQPERALLELGPGQVLGSLVLQHPACRSATGDAAAVLAALPHSYEGQADLAVALGALGKLWLLGARVDWQGLHRHQRRHRVLLPTYPFERQRYWIETGGQRAAAAQALAVAPLAGDAPAATGGSNGDGNGRRAGGIGSYARPSLRVAYAPPADEVEAAIAELWQDLLGVSRVGVDDRFLELGGDSLLATRLVARMRDALGVDLPVRLFFERSTVAELAAAVREISGRNEEDAAAAQELVEKVRSLSEEEMEMELVRLESLVGGEEAVHG